MPFLQALLDACADGHTNPDPYEHGPSDHSERNRIEKTDRFTPIQWWLFVALLGEGLLLMLFSQAGILPLAIAMIFGSASLSLLAATGAAVTVGLRRGGLLVSLLILPLYVPVLIFGIGPFPALGIAGGGTAVVLFYAGATVVMAWYILSGRNVAGLHFSRPRWPLFRTILAVGFFSSISSVLTNVIIAIATALVASVGGANAGSTGVTGAVHGMGRGCGRVAWCWPSSPSTSRLTPIHSTVARLLRGKAPAPASTRSNAGSPAGV